MLFTKLRYSLTQTLENFSSVRFYLVSIASIVVVLSDMICIGSCKSSHPSMKQATHWTPALILRLKWPGSDQGRPRKTQSGRPTGWSSVQWCCHPCWRESYGKGQHDRSGEVKLSVVHWKKGGEKAKEAMHISINICFSFKRDKSKWRRCISRIRTGRKSGHQPPPYH